MLSSLAAGPAIGDFALGLVIGEWFEGIRFTVKEDTDITSYLSSALLLQLLANKGW